LLGRLPFDSVDVLDVEVEPRKVVGPTSPNHLNAETDGDAGFKIDSIVREGYPADLPPERVRQLVDAVRQMEGGRIEID
jgi:hypothetical protein